MKQTIEWNRRGSAGGQVGKPAGEKLAPASPARRPAGLLACLAALCVSVFSLTAAEQHFNAGEWNLDLYGTGSLANDAKHTRDDAVLGGGLGLNYWITRGFGIGVRGESDNLPTGFEHSVFDRALLRVSVRAPLWDRIAPYGYCEGGYLFERDRWGAGAGGGLDFRLAKGWALFGEAGLQVTGQGEGSGKASAGVRLCF